MRRKAGLRPFSASRTFVVFVWFVVENDSACGARGVVT
jgi:hypothetical protein